MTWVSLGLLAAASALLALFWGDVPDRWVIHWDAHGRPDGWAPKSLGGAAIPLLVGLLAVLLLEAAARWSRSGGSGRGPARSPLLLSVRARVLQAVALAIALLAASLSLALPLLRPRSALPVVLGVVSELAVIVGGTAVWANRTIRRARAAGADIPEGYTGIFYDDARDRRLWVPRASGLGWTINYGHRLAWPVTIALVGLPIAILLVLAVHG